MATLADIVIRPESATDHTAIYDLTRRAFAPMPFSGGDEQDLIDRLRKEDQLSISLVAVSDGKIIGHIAFSPASAHDGSKGWFALGPVSVEPKLQGKNVGSKLINKGIAMLREQEASGCVLIGNPDYYKRFGFEPYPDLAPEGEPSEYFQILAMKTAKPEAVVNFHPLFHAGTGES